MEGMDTWTVNFLVNCNADLPIFFRVISLALGQPYDCPSASEGVKTSNFLQPFPWQSISMAMEHCHWGKVTFISCIHQPLTHDSDGGTNDSSLTTTAAAKTAYDPSLHINSIIPYNCMHKCIDSGYISYGQDVWYIL